VVNIAKNAEKPVEQKLPELSILKRYEWVEIIDGEIVIPTSLYQRSMFDISLEAVGWKDMGDKITIPLNNISSMSVLDPNDNMTWVAFNVLTKGWYSVSLNFENNGEFDDSINLVNSTGQKQAEDNMGSQTMNQRYKKIQQLKNEFAQMYQKFYSWKGERPDTIEYEKIIKKYNDA
jgi:hypothetical protein